MSDMEYQLRNEEVKWIWLKIYDKKKIAVGCYLYKKGQINYSKPRKLNVVLFASAVGLLGDKRITMVNGTERKFAKKDKKIARWYFEELCSTFKNGILDYPVEENRRT